MEGVCKGRHGCPRMELVSAGEKQRGMKRHDQKKKEEELT